MQLLTNISIYIYLSALLLGESIILHEHDIYTLLIQFLVFHEIEGIRDEMAFDLQQLLFRFFLRCSALVQIG